MSTIFLLSIPSASPSSSYSLYKSNFNGRGKKDPYVRKVDVVRLYAHHPQIIYMIISIHFLCWIMLATTTTMAASAAITYDELYHHQQQQQQRNHKTNQEKPHSKGTFEDSGGSSSTFADLHTSSSLKRFMPTNDEPEFVGQIPNLTVSVGRDAKFPCIVNNLDTYRVGWIKNEDKAILTIQHQVVTRNNRISLTQSEHKIWTLHIKNVQESDRGGYMCQINTMPMKSQIGYLDVTVPPDFINTETSSDVMVRENQNLTLKCKARGHPEPKLTWRREDNKPIEYGNWQINKESGMEYPISIESNTITINKVSRLHMGAYLCIAQNGVPPSVSRRIVLQVNFPPMIWVPNQLLGASIGDEIALECDTEAFPLSLNYWTKEEKNHQHHDTTNGGVGNGIGEEIMIVNSDKYRMSNTENSYKVHMKLIIKKITSDDFGTYRCHAKNSLGSTQGSIRIYEIHRTVSSKPSQSSSSTSTKSSSKEPSTARIQSLNDSSHKNDPNEEYYSTANAAAHHTVFLLHNNNFYSNFGYLTIILISALLVLL